MHHDDGDHDNDPRAELVSVLQAMVAVPERVRVTASRRGRTTVFTAHLDQEDIGKVIGRQGRTARALRAVLDARGAYDRRSYRLELRED
ncbi:MAG: KH domain-containing protein [Acidobacteriota bacterium]